MTTNIQNNLITPCEIADSWEDLASEYDSEHETEEETEHKTEHKTEEETEHKTEHKTEEETEHKTEHKTEEETEHKTEHKTEEETEEEFPILKKKTMQNPPQWSPPNQSNVYKPLISSSAMNRKSSKKIFTETGFKTEPVHQFPNSYIEDGESGMTHEQSVQKTRMCRSVETGENCPHGESCRFAHDSHELRTASCQFGENCRFVKWQTNGYYNTSARICKFLHPEETKQGYCTRVKIPYIDTPKVTTLTLGSAYLKPNNFLPAKKIDVQKTEFPKTEFQKTEFPKMDVPKKEFPKKEFPKMDVHKMEFPKMDVPKKDVPKKEFPKMEFPKMEFPKVGETELETILKVPREFALQSIELAMKSGKKNIRVEIY